VTWLVVVWFFGGAAGLVLRWCCWVVRSVWQCWIVGAAGLSIWVGLLVLLGGRVPELDPLLAELTAVPPDVTSSHSGCGWIQPA
jgi:hypothetical protein